MTNLCPCVVYVVIRKLSKLEGMVISSCRFEKENFSSGRNRSGNQFFRQNKNSYISEEGETIPGRNWNGIGCRKMPNDSRFWENVNLIQLLLVKQWNGSCLAGRSWNWTSVPQEAKNEQVRSQEMNLMRLLHKPIDPNPKAKKWPDMFRKWKLCLTEASKVWYW